MRASVILAAGKWDPARATDRVELDYDSRHRRRILLFTVAGSEVLLDLPQAVRLRDGDGLALDEGGVVRVEAKPESLAKISTHDPAALARIAWHLGNRHLAMQLAGDCIRIRADHVIEAMVQLLGGDVEHIEAPFDPEAGAYAGSHSHQHDDEHG